MQTRTLFLILVFVFCLVIHNPLMAQKFDFNDGTTQGWTLDQMYVTSSQSKFTPVIGYSLLNSNNELAANSGSLLIGRSDQNDIYLESPDLSSNSNWQDIDGISVDVKRTLYSPCWGDFSNIFYVQLQIKVIDSDDGNKEKLYAEYSGSDFVFHDISNSNQVYHLSWNPSWLSDPRYIVKNIRVRITGPGDVAAECWYRGGWTVDNVIGTGGGTSYNTNTGTNIQIDLGNGVDVTFDQVTGAGNTLMSISGNGTPPPGGFQIIPSGSPVYYDIETSATFTGDIEICITYNDAGLTAQQESALKLQVYENPPGQWVDITTSVNTSSNVICCVVNHLSEFAVMLFTESPTDEWVLTNEPIHGMIDCFTVSGNNLFAGTEGGGVFLSTNNGINWNAMNTDLTNTGVRALCASGTNIFAGTWGGGVFISTNNGASWTPVNTGLGHLSVTTLYASGTSLLAGTWGGGVFLSTNNGASWTAVNNGITETHIRALYISGTNFFAGTINGLFVSTNNGASWTAINSGLINTAAISLEGIAVNGGEKLFTGTDGGGIFTSINTGAEWSAANTGLTELHVPYLVKSAVNIFAATWGGGVFLKMNNSEAWISVNDGMTSTNIRSLIISDAYIFAGSEDGRIWRRPLSAMIINKPEIDVIPETVTASVSAGQVIIKSMSISNTGDADLEFSIRGNNSQKIPGEAKDNDVGAEKNPWNTKELGEILNGNYIGENLPEWLIVSPLSGTLSPGDQQEISLIFNAAGLTPDVYTTEIVVSSNDSDTPNIMVPVILEVSPITSVNNSTNSPTEYALLPNYPNPFNSGTTISCQLKEPGIVKLEIFNISGQKVCTLLNSYKPAGEFIVKWSGLDDYHNPLPSGIYWMKMGVNQFTDIQKMMYLK